MPQLAITGYATFGIPEGYRDNVDLFTFSDTYTWLCEDVWRDLQHGGKRPYYSVRHEAHVVTRQVAEGRHRTDAEARRTQRDAS